MPPRWSLYSLLRAQETDEDGQFHLGFTGSAVFPYDPKGQSDPGGEGINFKAGAGFTAAFKEGFSTEMECGYQKAGIVGPSANLSQNIDLGGSIGVIGFEDFPLPSITIENDGAIKTQSLMGNFYYRYPKWRVRWRSRSLRDLRKTLRVSHFPTATTAEIIQPIPHS